MVGTSSQQQPQHPQLQINGFAQKYMAEMEAVRRHVILNQQGYGNSAAATSTQTKALPPDKAAGTPKLVYNNNSNNTKSQTTNIAPILNNHTHALNAMPGQMLMNLPNHHQYPIPYLNHLNPYLASQLYPNLAAMQPFCLPIPPPNSTISSTPTPPAIEAEMMRKMHDFLALTQNYQSDKIATEMDQHLLRRSDNLPSHPTLATEKFLGNHYSTMANNDHTSTNNLLNSSQFLARQQSLLAYAAAAAAQNHYLQQQQHHQNNTPFDHSKGPNYYPNFLAQHPGTYSTAISFAQQAFENGYSPALLRPPYIFPTNQPARMSHYDMTNGYDDKYYINRTHALDPNSNATVGKASVPISVVSQVKKSPKIPTPDLGPKITNFAQQPQQIIPSLMNPAYGAPQHHQAYMAAVATALYPYLAVAAAAAVGGNGANTAPLLNPNNNIPNNQPHLNHLPPFQYGPSFYPSNMFGGSLFPPNPSGPSIPPFYTSSSCSEFLNAIASQQLMQHPHFLQTTNQTSCSTMNSTLKSMPKFTTIPDFEFAMKLQQQQQKVNVKKPALKMVQATLATSITSNSGTTMFSSVDNFSMRSNLAGYGKRDTNYSTRALKLSLPPASFNTNYRNNNNHDEEGVGNLSQDDSFNLPPHPFYAIPPFAPPLFTSNVNMSPGQYKQSQHSQDGNLEGSDKSRSMPHNKTKITSKLGTKAAMANNSSTASKIVRGTTEWTVPMSTPRNISPNKLRGIYNIDKHGATTPNHSFITITQSIKSSRSTSVLPDGGSSSNLYRSANLQTDISNIYQIKGTTTLTQNHYSRQQNNPFLSSSNVKETLNLVVSSSMSINLNNSASRFTSTKKHIIEEIHKLDTCLDMLENQLLLFKRNKFEMSLELNARFTGNINLAPSNSSPETSLHRKDLVGLHEKLSLAQSNVTNIVGCTNKDSLYAHNKLISRKSHVALSAKFQIPKCNVALTAEPILNECKESCDHPNICITSSLLPTTDPPDTIPDQFNKRESRASQISDIILRKLNQNDLREEPKTKRARAVLKNRISTIRKHQYGKNAKFEQVYRDKLESWYDSVTKARKIAKRRNKEAKAREFFENQFPELRDDRLERERLRRIWTRNTCGNYARTETDVEEISKRLLEQEEEKKKLLNLSANIQPMLSNQEKEFERRIVFIDPLRIVPTVKHFNFECQRYRHFATKTSVPLSYTYNLEHNDIPTDPNIVSDCYIFTDNDSPATFGQDSKLPLASAVPLSSTPLPLGPTNNIDVSVMNIEEAAIESSTLLPLKNIDEASLEPCCSEYEKIDYGILTPLEIKMIKMKHYNPWTIEEHETFKRAYTAHPKEFELIAKDLTKKDTKDCVLHYYRTKKIENYKKLVAKRKIASKKRKINNNNNPTVNYTNNNSSLIFSSSITNNNNTATPTADQAISISCSHTTTKSNVPPPSSQAIAVNGDAQPSICETSFESRLPDNKRRLLPTTDNSNREDHHRFKLILPKKTDDTIYGDDSNTSIILKINEDNTQAPTTFKEALLEGKQITSLNKVLEASPESKGFKEGAEEGDSTQLNTTNLPTIITTTQSHCCMMMDVDGTSKTTSALRSDNIPSITISQTIVSSINNTNLTNTLKKNGFETHRGETWKSDRLFKMDREDTFSPFKIKLTRHLSEPKIKDELTFSPHSEKAHMSREIDALSFISKTPDLRLSNLTAAECKYLPNYVSQTTNLIPTLTAASTSETLNVVKTGIIDHSFFIPKEIRFDKEDNIQNICNTITGYGSSFKGVVENINVPLTITLQGIKRAFEDDDGDSKYEPSFNSAACSTNTISSPCFIQESSLSSSITLNCPNSEDKRLKLDLQSPQSISTPTTDYGSENTNPWPTFNVSTIQATTFLPDTSYNHYPSDINNSQTGFSRFSNPAIQAFLSTLPKDGTMPTLPSQHQQQSIQTNNNNNNDDSCENSLIPSNATINRTLATLPFSQQTNSISSYLPTPASIKGNFGEFRGDALLGAVIAHQINQNVSNADSIELWNPLKHNSS